MLPIHGFSQCILKGKIASEFPPPPLAHTSYTEEGYIVTIRQRLNPSSLHTELPKSYSNPHFLGGYTRLSSPRPYSLCFLHVPSLFYSFSLFTFINPLSCFYLPFRFLLIPCPSLLFPFLPFSFLPFFSPPFSTPILSLFSFTNLSST